MSRWRDYRYKKWHFWFSIGPSIIFSVLMKITFQYALSPARDTDKSPWLTLTSETIETDATTMVNVGYVWNLSRHEDDDLAKMFGSTLDAVSSDRYSLPVIEITYRESRGPVSLSLPVGCPFLVAARWSQTVSLFPIYRRSRTFASGQPRFLLYPFPLFLLFTHPNLRLRLATWTDQHFKHFFVGFLLVLSLGALKFTE